MSWKPTLFLAAAALLMGVFLFFVEPAIRPKPVELKQPMVLESDDLAGVMKMEFQQAGKELVVCERIRENNRSEWIITAPIRVKATPIMDSLADAARRIPIRSTVDPSAAESPDVYGLEKPRVIVTLRTKERNFTLKFGNASQATKGLVFLRKGESPEILLVDRHFFEQFDKGLNDLRDRLVLSFETNEIEKAVIGARVIREQRESVEEVELVRGRDGRWRMTRPIDIDVDAHQMIRFIQDMRNLHAEEFVMASPNLADYGLDRPQLIVSLWARGASEPMTVHFGDFVKTRSGPLDKADPRMIYARNVDTVEVAIVPRDRYDPIPREPSHFRSRTLFPYRINDVVRLHLSSEDGTLEIGRFEEEVEREGRKVKVPRWKVTSPAGFKAVPGGVERFLTGVLSIGIADFVERDAKNWGTFGLDLPKMTLTLTVNKTVKDNDGKEGVTQVERKVFFGRKGESGDGYVRIDGDDEVCAILQRDFEPLELAEWNFRDPVFLEIPSDSIRELRVEILEWIVGNPEPVRGGYVCKKEEGRWKMIDPPMLRGKDVDEDKLNDILARMNYFKVIQYVTRKASDIEPMGLEQYAVKADVLYAKKEAKEGEPLARATLRISSKIKESPAHFGKFDHSPAIFALDPAVVDLIRDGVEKKPPPPTLVPEGDRH